MLLHIEGGHCNSGFNGRALYLLAARCPCSNGFMDQGFRRNVLDGHRENFYRLTDFRPWKCPGCDRSFEKLSGLFSHVEDGVCEQTIDNGAVGELKRWLDWCT